jgi:acyl-coenzyme A synthetase/AMP-(fatty) acid ligase
MQTNDDFVNISYHLERTAKIQPYKRAVVYPVSRDRKGRIAYAHLTFQQLAEEVDRTARGLTEAGICRGTRTVLMVKPGPNFFSLVFALFKTGAVPVVVDPGMGIKRMLSCLGSTRPEAFIGIPPAHILRTLFPGFFKTVKVWITAGRRLFWGGHTLDAIRSRVPEPYPEATTKRNDTAAILFTTGSTGPAKGAVYTHGNFDAQIRIIREHFRIAPDEIDLPTFPLFALFDPALGMTAVIPDMDPTRPALVNPVRIIEAVINQGVTNMFASPALLNRVGRYGKSKGIILPSLKRVVSAGAPVSLSNIKCFSSMLTGDARIHTPYGATEAVPVISIESGEILSETGRLSEQGHGICVGTPLNGIDVKIIGISDRPVTEWSDDIVVPEGEAGEITVKGDLVTERYFENPEADALAKIKDVTVVRHRMGDLGRRDEKGRIWFLGRKSHRVITKNGTLFTIPCEAIFNNHPEVFRSALVGIGEIPRQTPIMCIELEKESKTDRKTLEKELLEIAEKNDLTRDIKKFLFCKSFPVDIRHNSKIFREKLAKRAEKKIGKEGGK